MKNKLKTGGCAGWPAYRDPISAWRLLPARHGVFDIRPRTVAYTGARHSAAIASNYEDTKALDNYSQIALPALPPFRKDVSFTILASALEQKSTTPEHCGENNPDSGCSALYLYRGPVCFLLLEQLRACSHGRLLPDCRPFFGLPTPAFRCFEDPRCASLLRQTARSEPAILSSSR